MPDKDTAILVIGRSRDRLTALQAGRIDATWLNPPLNKIAAKQGFNELRSMVGLMNVYTGGLAATLRKIKEDPDSIVRTIRATLRGTRLIKDKKSEFIAVFKKESGRKDEKLASQVYDELVGLYAETGIPKEAGILENIAIAKDMMGITRKVAISDVADWSLARKAAKGLK